MSPDLRLRILLLATTLALAACGGSEDGALSTDQPGATNEVPTTVAPGSDAGGSQEPAETTTTSADDSDASGAREVDVSEATIVLGGETYLFKEFADGAKRCQPDGAGGEAFWVELARADESGARMEADPNDEEFIHGLGITLLLEDLDAPESEISLLAAGPSWFASSGGDERSGIDSVSIEGNHLHGTATFVRFEAPDEAPVSGTFEVTCAG